MKLKITIDTDNAAFEGDNLGPELARLLRYAADGAEALEDQPAEWKLPLRDLNGNYVGTAVLK